MIQTSTPAFSGFDRAGDVLKFEANPLDAIFTPKNVAVIGATETQGSVGRTILWNLISNPFGGTVFPVNPKRPLAVPGASPTPGPEGFHPGVEL